MICLGSAVCPDETVEWYTCVRKAVKSLKDPAVPYEDCAPRRQLLERCSHAAIGLLLDVALMLPPARAAEPSPWPEADGE